MLQPIIGYLKWWVWSKNLHGVHSPFLFKFVRECVYGKDELSKFQNIEQIRDELLKNQNVLTFTDYGAGSAKDKRRASGADSIINRRISQIAKNSLQQKKYCRLLHRIVNYFQVNTVLELGTSLGITTSYLAIGDNSPTIYTVEGAKTIAENAQQVFERQNLKNICLFTNTFDEYFQTIEKDTKFDLVIIDGNHRGDATLKYFDLIVQHIHNGSVVILDDIRWSESMYKAWCAITRSSDATVTLDLYKLGIVFFNKNLSKENFKIRF